MYENEHSKNLLNRSWRILSNVKIFKPSEVLQKIQKYTPTIFKIWWHSPFHVKNKFGLDKVYVCSNIANKTVTENI